MIAGTRTLQALWASHCLIISLATVFEIRHCGDQQRKGNESPYFEQCLKDLLPVHVQITKIQRVVNAASLYQRSRPLVAIVSCTFSNESTASNKLRLHSLSHGPLTVLQFRRLHFSERLRNVTKLTKASPVLSFNSQPNFWGRTSPP